MPLKQKRTENLENSLWKQALLSMGLILSIPTTLGVFVIVGIYLDKYFNTGTIFFIVCGLIGILITGYNMYVLWKKFGQ